MGIIENKFQLLLHPANVLTKRKNKHLKSLRRAAKSISNQEGEHRSLAKLKAASSTALPVNCGLLATVSGEGRAPGSQGPGRLFPSEPLRQDGARAGNSIPSLPQRSPR